MENKNPVATQQFVDKSTHFLQGMQLLADDVPNFRSGIPLLAVHSAISLNDAITVGMTGERGKYQDHAEAAQVLEKICAEQRLSDTRGVGHFKWLLSRKNKIAYDGAFLDDAFVNQVKDKAERFSTWAYTQFREVLRAEASS